MTVDVPFSVSRVQFTNTGSDNFIVWMFAPDGSKELLVNTIGSYKGYRPLLAGKGKYSLEIEGTEWTATIESIPIKQFAYDSNSGIGDYVSPLFEPEDRRSVYEFVHNGDENFVVWLYCAGGTDLLQNDIGPVNNTAMVEFGEGPCLFDVTADGSWSIKREQ
jgi:hypothetical protein